MTMIENKENVIKEVGKNYFTLLRQHNFFPDHNQDLNLYHTVEQACSQHGNWEHFIENVEKAYYSLSHTHQEIIKKDFFYNNYPWWYESRMSRGYYLIHRQQAVKNFTDRLIQYRAITHDGKVITNPKPVVKDKKVLDFER